MVLRVADRIWDTTITTGTGPITLANTPPLSYSSFGSVCSNNDTIYYAIAHQTISQWEVGLGTYNSAGPTITRTTVLSSSNGGSLVVFSAGNKDVLGVWPASKLSAIAPIVAGVRSASAVTVNASAITDYFLALDPSSNAITVNLPSSPATGLSFLIKDATGHASTNNITVVPASGNIDGASNFVLNIDFQSVAVTYTGTQWSIN